MELFTMQQVEDMLKLDRSTIKNNIDAGKLKAYRTGRKYLFSKEQIQEFLNNGLIA